jgi:RIO kinase 1
VREHHLPDPDDPADRYADHTAHAGSHDDDETAYGTVRIRRRRGPVRPEPGRRGRLTERERDRLAAARDDADPAERPAFGDRWTTWGEAEHGPEPRPGWVVTDLAAEDVELGVLKTGKEADVHLLRRTLDADDPGGVLAAKRYRGGDHRLFHRDTQYLEGRRMRRSRENRAMASRSAFGRNLIAEQWAAAEFAALTRLWSEGAPVPYPVQLHGTELLMEYLAEPDGTASPRLAQTRPDPDALHGLWDDLVHALAGLARAGLTHGDLSAYNVLVHDGQPWLIDLPQVVDLAANPAGPEFLARDVRNITGWFTARGLPPEVADADAVTALLLDEAGLT